MKKSIFTILAFFLAILSYAQVGIGTTTPNSTLDVRGSMATNYRSFAASTSAASTDNLLVFTGSSAATLTLPTAVGCAGRSYMIKNASTTGPTPLLTIATTSSQTIDGVTTWLLDYANETVTVVSDGSNWDISAQNQPAASNTDWSQGGNSVASTSALGTTSNFDLPFITNNTEKMRLTSNGNLGVGTSTFNVTNPEKLVVDAGTTSSVNAIVGKGSIDSYLQLNIQNNSAGTSSSSDVVATANNGSETTNYVDMGINGGNNTSGVMGAANDGYLYNIGQNFLVGTGTAAKSLIFMTGGTSQVSNERMRIDGSGNVGIGIPNPTYKLQVNAASNPLFLAGVQTGAPTDSLLMIMNGVVKKLSPSALTVSSSNAWALLGNNNTLASNYFLGTTNTDPLIVKTNSTQVSRFNQNAIALGISATTNNSTHSYALGSSATVGFNKTNAYAIGSGATVNADSSFAIGNSAVANGKNSFAIGPWAAANNASSVAIGYSAVTAYSISDALAIGTNATANASNSIAIGSNATLANKTVTNAVSAIAIGNTAVSNSVSSIAIGTGALANYSISPAIVIGNNAVVNGNSGVAIGNGATIGNISNAMALGVGASATNTAANSSAIGYNASATLANEIILGDRSNTALSVGIGTESFSGSNREKLLVDAGTTTSVNAIVGKGTIDSYLQLNIQNLSAGTSSSSDVVATANNGNETSNYVDMGINGGNYTGGVMGAANDGYLYTMGNNFLIGTGNAAKSLVFMTGGTTQATNERMRVDGSGNVGIGTISPTQKLDINGNLRLSGAFMPGNAAGTSGYLLQSNGAGVAPSWTDPATSVNALAWSLGGNNVSSIQKLGTTSNFDLPFITNNTERMRIDANGKVGIGTATIPKAGIGAAKFALEGADGSSSGPHMQFTTSADNYPLMQFLPWQHDYQYIPFDAYFDGASWKSGTTAGGNFVLAKEAGKFLWYYGNTNTQGSAITWNPGVTLNNAGKVGIGTSTFDATNPEKLLVDAGTTTSFNVISGKGTINNYLQLNIQNKSAGTAASSDVVATADNGNESVNFVDMGINSSGYSGAGILGGVNNGYLYSTGNDFVIGNATSSKDLILFTGGTATTNERMRLTANGTTVTGSITVSYRSGAGNYTVLATDYVVINTGAAATWTLPAAGSCSGRVYRLLNQGTGNITLSIAVTTASGTTTTSLVNTAGSNFFEILSDGTNWRRIN
jgi:hypothetical protein